MKNIESNLGDRICSSFFPGKRTFWSCRPRVEAAFAQHTRSEADIVPVLSREGTSCHIPRRHQAAIGSFDDMSR
jgi:hypothetical protein